ncbi:MAG: extracellular solute-binding protein [Tagaea sp.]|nr:extracellular solute-binding protein [Tagaea sp.]
MSTQSAGKSGAVETARAAKLQRRSLLKAALGGIVATTASLKAPYVAAQARPFAGVTINGSSFQHVFQSYIRELLPEFEAQTGIKVNLDLQSFPIYNQRMDLELSTRSSGYDFCNISFIYSGRWIGSGWLTPLDEMAADPAMTPASWDPADFLSGPQSTLRNAQGKTFGFAWEGGAMIMSAARGDVLEQAGVGLPRTFDELVKACEATAKVAGVAPFVSDRLHHWNWPPYLMGFGGRVFRGAPDDLFPLLDTPEAIAGAEWYANLLVEYGPRGVLTFNDDQALRAQLAGQANLRTQVIGWMTPLVGHADSKVRQTTRFAPMPSGPAGYFPGANSVGYGIPAAARNKAAAWEFIKWALSKETLRKIVSEKGYTAVCRRSIVADPQFVSTMTFNGTDIATLYSQVLDHGGKEGYMKYRTLPIFPQVGDKINKAIERIASKQGTAAEAMRQAQAEAIVDLRKAGIAL